MIVMAYYAFRLIITGEARYAWLHGIAWRKTDCLEEGTMVERIISRPHWLHGFFFAFRLQNDGVFLVKYLPMRCLSYSPINKLSNVVFLLLKVTMCCFILAM